MDSKYTPQSIEGLISRVQENERLDRHFANYELRLLNAQGFEPLLDILIVGAKEHFQLDDVSLFLVDRNGSLNGLLSKNESTFLDEELRLKASDEFGLFLYGNKPRILLHNHNTQLTADLFAHFRDAGSFALVPLLRHGRLIGSLHFASRDRERFTPDKATDFLQRLANILAICLENGLAHESLKTQSRVDVLTQVSNRRHFDLEFAKELERSNRRAEPLTCLFLDLDHFKSINDRFGHGVGDRCLQQVARTTEHLLRKTDLLARYGGEEFVVLLPLCDELEARRIAERIRQAVSLISLTTVDDQQVRPTVSIGVCCWTPDGRRKDLPQQGRNLLKCADDAMYDAKSGGRNRVKVRPFSLGASPL